MRGFVAELVRRAAKAVELDAGSVSDIAKLAPHEYRLSLVASFAYKLLLSAQGPPLPPRLASAVADSLAAAADRLASRAALFTRNG